MNTDDLVSNNLGLVGTTIKKYYNYLLDYYEFEDLFQIGCFGLMEAARKYKGKLLRYQFSTIAFYYIRTQMNRAAKKIYSRKYGPSFNELYLDNPVKSNYEAKKPLGDLVAVDDCFAPVENRMLLEQLFKELNKQEKLIVNMLLNGYTQREIADQLNVSQSRVNYLKQRAFKKMKEGCNCQSYAL